MNWNTWKILEFLECARKRSGEFTVCGPKQQKRYNTCAGPADVGNTGEGGGEEWLHCCPVLAEDEGLQQNPSSGSGSP